MLTNYDLMWMYVKKLMEELTSTTEKLLDEQLFKNYCKSFEQLMQIVEVEHKNIKPEKLEELKFYLENLEKQYEEAQNGLRYKIDSERLNAMAHSAYTRAGKFLNNYNKKS